MPEHTSSLLQRIDSPQALRALSRTQLQPLADELRTYLLESVAKTGGHLSSNLGTVELTVALHYVFNRPLIHQHFGGFGHGPGRPTKGRTAPCNCRHW